WPTLASRKVYVCYKGTRIEQIRRVASAASSSFGRSPRFTDKAWEYDRDLGFSHLRSPLPATLYGFPIAELYEASGSWAFYGIYTCQICDLLFETKYGRLGRGFAEAHHRLSLSRLRPGVVTRVNDLITVCANCHRMLHKMKGTTSDASALRRAVRARR